MLYNIRILMILILIPLSLHADIDKKQPVIGIETALPSESIQILPLIKPYKMTKINGIKYYNGQYEGHPIVLVNTGHGKINAAAVTANLINVYHPQFILFFGTAGKLDDSLEIGDIVVAKATLYFANFFKEIMATYTAQYPRSSPQ